MLPLRREVELPARPLRRLSLHLAAVGLLCALVTAADSAPLAARSTRHAAELVSRALDARAVAADASPRAGEVLEVTAELDADAQAEMHRQLMEQLDPIDAVGGPELDPEFLPGGRYSTIPSHSARDW